MKLFDLIDLEAQLAWDRGADESAIAARDAAIAARLSPEDRARHVDLVGSTENYQLRQLMFLLKMVAGMAWGQSPEVRQAMGLSPYPEDPGTWRQA